jgi:hypothetical protein
VGLCPSVAEIVLKYCGACVETLLWDCAKMLLQLCQDLVKYFQKKMAQVLLSK